MQLRRVGQRHLVDRQQAHNWNEVTLPHWGRDVLGLGHRRHRLVAASEALG
jgi:hypothetical protein